MLHSLAIFRLFFPLPSPIFRGSDFSPKQWVQRNKKKEMENGFFGFRLNVLDFFPSKIGLNLTFITFSSYWALVALWLTGRGNVTQRSAPTSSETKSSMQTFPISIYSFTLILRSHIIPLCDKPMWSEWYFPPTDAHVFSGNDPVLGSRLWDSPESGKLLPHFHCYNKRLYNRNMLT